MHPGTKTAVTPKFVHFGPGLYERFLGTILRFTGIAGHPQTKPVDLADVQPVQGLECPGIRGLGLFDPNALVIRSLCCHHRIFNRKSRCEGGVERFQQ